LRKKAFYLVGPIQWADDFMSWREDMREFLENLGHEAIFPWGEIYHGKLGKAAFSKWLKRMSVPDFFGRVRKYMRRYVIKWDIKAVEACDGVIFWLPRNVRTVGSYGEATLIYYLIYHKRLKKYKGRRKKIFVVTDIPPQELGYWLIGCSDRIFTTMDKFKEYFEENYDKRGKKVG